MLKRITFLLYGLLAYALFLPTFVYAIGFVGNFRIPIGDWIFVPKSLDSGGAAGPWWQALVIDLAVLGLFAVQHSGMARQGFKKVWTRIVPWPIERTTYVLASTLALIVLMYFWRPLGGTVWSVHGNGVQAALIAVSLVGWGIVLLATFLIDHFELFGLRQVYYQFTGRKLTGPRFVTPFLYKAVRHPLYLGFLLAFWATPVMTIGHLVFAVATTGYILVAIQFEERDLVRLFGDAYRDYRRRVSMLLPFPPKQAVAKSTLDTEA